MAHNDLCAICFSPNPLVGAAERALDYNPNPIKYALLCDLELVSFLFWASISSENDIMPSRKPSLAHPRFWWA